MERREFSEAENFEPFTSLDLDGNPKRKRNKDKDKDKNQRRFSDEQIKLLETMFESETRLEPKKKLELARELGLQPRQVAIWFQNRRARWKSKQIEQDLRALRADYDSLASKFESLKEEKQSLLSQLSKLNDLMRKAAKGEDEGLSCKISNKKRELANPSLQNGLEDRVDFMTNNVVDELGEQQGHDELHTSQEIDASLVSLESWYRVEEQGSTVFDQPRGFSQWLNFWS